MYISDATTDDDTTTTTTTTTATAQTATAPTSTSSQPHHCRHQRNHHQPTCPLLKKRAETWVQDETRSLINFRKDMDSQFNTSKSNKHLWEEISSKMRERGFDRSPTMCTDKWRNLLKEFKKVKHHSRNSGGGGGNGGGGGGGNGFNGSAKMSYYKEIDEILRERNRCSSAAAAMLQNHLDDGGGGGGGHLLKADPFMHFSDKGVDDASIPFGPMEANGRPTLNLETDLDHEGHPLAITAVDTVTGSGVPPSFWRETPGNGGDTHSYGGRVITVKWGDYTRRIGVDGIADAIKDVIRSAFGLRTRRAFWLEDEDQIVRSLDREMPLGTYTLHLDEGMTIKLCHYQDSDHIPFPGQSISHTEEKTFYTEDDFREFMNRRGWSSLRELSGYRNIDNLDDLRPDALYRGMT